MLLIFDLVVSIMIYIDKKQYKTFLTPFCLFAGIYLILINLNNLIISHIYGYYLVNANSLASILLLLVFIFCISLFFGRLNNVLRPSKTKFQICERVGNKTALVFFGIGLAAYLLSFVLNVYSRGFGEIKGENNGLLGHLSFLGFIFSPIVLEKAKKAPQRHKFIYYFAVAVLFVVSVLFGGKYVIVINAAYLFIYYAFSVRTSFKKRIKVLAALLLCGCVAFLFIYFVFPMISGEYGSDATARSALDFTIEHFFCYLLSPIVANNYVLTHRVDGGLQIAFTVPINIFKGLFGGEYVSPIYEHIFPYAAGEVTNVAGLLGEAIYCMGYAGGMAYLFLIFCFIYTLYLVYRRTGRYKLTVCNLLAMLLFGFFCNFFTVSGMVLQIIYMFAFESYFQIIGGRDVKKRVGYCYSELERNRRYH